MTLEKEEPALNDVLVEKVSVKQSVSEETRNQPIEERRGQILFSYCGPANNIRLTTGCHEIEVTIDDGEGWQKNGKVYFQPKYKATYTDTLINK